MDNIDGLGVHLLHSTDPQLLDPIKRSFEDDLDASPGRMRIFYIFFAMFFLPQKLS
jgi:hypothetical protein